LKSYVGIIGAFLLAIGGAIGFEALNVLFFEQTTGALGPSSHAGDFLGFIAFLSMGFGLWLIVQSGNSKE
jgi:hypothetical protein